MHWIFKLLRTSIWLIACAGVAVQASAISRETDGLEAIRAADLRLAAIGFRLSVSAATLCDKHEPGLGLQLHTLAQYDPAARSRVKAHFGFAGAVAIEAVVPGSPAERAGLKQDDTLVRIGDLDIPRDAPGEASTAQLVALHAALAGLPPENPVDMVLVRNGVPVPARVVPVRACRTRYELKIADGFDARANGELVQITSRYIEAVDADLLPAVIAHELAHNILRHRERLDAAGAQFGIASGFGRNLGLFRQTEIQADILSVHLLARAGYSPQIAARFWREAGPKLLEGKFRSRSHPALADRITAVEREAARIAAAGGNASLPAFFATRDQPLDGDWKGLLVPPR